MKQILNFGLIGCGNISKTHIEALGKLPSAKFLAACDTYAPNLEAAVRAHGVRGYSSHRELLQDRDIDVVTILTASGTHSDIGIEAARAGKHVIVEKPIDVTVEAAQALIDACRESGVMLSCIFQHRFDASVTAMKQAIAQGRLGRLNGCCCHTKWYRPQEYYDAVNWRGTFKLDGGGALMNQSIHYIDLMQHLMGPVDEVFGYTATLAHGRIEAEDVGMAALRFKSGALGIIEGTTSAYPGFYTRLDVQGDRGSILLENDAILRWELADGSVCDESLKHKGPQPHHLQIQDVIDAIQSGREPAVGGDEALKSLRIVLAVYESARTQKPVKL